MRRLAGNLLLTALLLAMPMSLTAVEIKPVVNAQVLGGQYYYNGSESAFGALASLVASPYMKLDDRWSLVPLYSGTYQGTQQVQDLVGGGTLFQDSQNHNVSLKGIRSLGHGLKLKAVAGYGAELLRETKDESWGDGLYDNRRLSAGTEAEWSWSKDDYLRLAYDYYAIRFPNYQSLSSEAAALGQGRELDAPDVLNSQNHMVTLGGQFAMPAEGILEASLSRTWSSYKDQHIVDGTGALTPDTRSDQAEALFVQGTWPVFTAQRWRLLGAFGYTRTHLYSSQNHYDASQTFFNPDYYGYLTHMLRTQWTVLAGDPPWAIEWSGSLSRQHYSGRLVQDSDGVYGTDITHVDYAATALSVSYPIAKGFSVKATAALGWNNSNNTDNKIYQYHYNIQTYLFGFTYAY